MNRPNLVSFVLFCTVLSILVFNIAAPCLCWPLSSVGVILTFQEPSLEPLFFLLVKRSAKADQHI